MSSNRLVNQIKAKDERAFEALYDEFNKIVYYVIYQIVKHHDTTKDLVQETFIAIYNKIEQYEGGNLKYWILTIAKNIAFNFYNRKIVKEQKVIRNDEYLESIEASKHTGLGKYDDLLEEHFNQEEKDLIVYHVVFGYSYKDLSFIFDEKPKTIGNKCRRLVKILKTLVKEA